MATDQPTKKGVGRPTKCTPEVRKRIVDMVKAGCYRQHACAAAGVSVGTFCRWMETNRSPYREFREAVLEAEALSIANLTMRVTKAAQDGDWKAALALLERKCPKEFGRKDRHVIEDAEGREVIPLAILRDAVARTQVDGDDF